MDVDTFGRSSTDDGICQNEPCGRRFKKEPGINSLLCPKCRFWEHHYHLAENLCVEGGSDECFMCKQLSELQPKMNLTYENLEDLSGVRFDSSNPDYAKNEIPKGNWKEWKFFWNHSLKSLNIKLGDCVYVKQIKSNSFDLMRVQYLIEDAGGKPWFSGYLIYSISQTQAKCNIDISSENRKNFPTMKFVTTLNGWAPLSSIYDICCCYYKRDYVKGRPYSVKPQDCFPLIYEYEKGKITILMVPDYQACKNSILFKNYTEEERANLSNATDGQIEKRQSLRRPGDFIDLSGPLKKKKGKRKAKSDSRDDDNEDYDSPPKKKASPASKTKPGPKSKKQSLENDSSTPKKPGPASRTSKPGPASSKSKPGPASSKPGPTSTKPGPASSKPGPASSRPGPASKKAALAYSIANETKEEAVEESPKTSSLPKSSENNDSGHGSSNNSDQEETYSPKKPGPASTTLNESENTDDTSKRPGPASRTLNESENVDETPRRPGPASRTLNKSSDANESNGTPARRPGPASKTKPGPASRRPGPASLTRPGPKSSKVPSNDQSETSAPEIPQILDPFKPSLTFDDIVEQTLNDPDI